MTQRGTTVAHGLRIGAALVIAIAITGVLAAQGATDFYRGKVLTIYIGYSAGGGYDVFARTIGRHISRHIPGNPSVRAVNMPGASSMVLANYLTRRAPRDGTAIGAVNAALVFDPLFLEKTAAQFKGPDLTMIGNAVSSASVLVTWKTSGIRTMDDLRSKPALIGATSATGDTYLLPKALKTVLRLDKMRIATGYPGTLQAALAMEQGEINGRVWDIDGIRAARPHWLRDGSLNIVAQFAKEKMAGVPASVPLAKDYATTDEDKRVLDVIALSTVLARPYIAPPGLAPDRTRTLRDAFMATMKDPAFLADIRKLQLTISPTSGAEMQQIVNDAYALPAPLIRRVRAVLAN